MKPYYYVYNPSGSRPTYRHASLESAVAESERLAALHPAVSFEVLQCVAISSSPKPKASTFFLDDQIVNRAVANNQVTNNAPPNKWNSF